MEGVGHHHHCLRCIERFAIEGGSNLSGTTKRMRWRFIGNRFNLCNNNSFTEDRKKENVHKYTQNFNAPVHQRECDEEERLE